VLSGRHFTVFQALGRNGTLTFCSRSRGRSLQLLQPCSRALLEQYVDSDHCVLENPLEPAIHPTAHSDDPLPLWPSLNGGFVNSNRTSVSRMVPVVPFLVRGRPFHERIR
jgi:hypothetical protein